MTDAPKFHAGTPERNLVYAWEGEIDALRAEITRLRDYARHKITCARIRDAVAKCDCGLDALLRESQISNEQLVQEEKDG